MTKKFNTTFTCEHCGKKTTMETAFHRWVRKNPLLDSQVFHIVCGDIDLFIHRYMLPADNKYSREIQLMMFIECKALGKDLEISQQDSLSIINQVFRNRRSNIYKKPRKQAFDFTPLIKVNSVLINRKIRLRMYGGHFLKMSGDSPKTSNEMMWDNKWKINEDQLIKLMRFELDPDNPDNKIDLRKHHKKEKSYSLPGME